MWSPLRTQIEAHWKLEGSSRWRLERERWRRRTLRRTTLKWLSVWEKKRQSTQRPQLSERKITARDVGSQNVLFHRKQNAPIKSQITDTLSLLEEQLDKSKNLSYLEVQRSKWAERRWTNIRLPTLSPEAKNERKAKSWWLCYKS